MFSKNKWLFFTIFLSVTLHSVVLLLLHHSASRTTTIKSKPEVKKFIQAKLIFEQPESKKINTAHTPKQIKPEMSSVSSDRSITKPKVLNKANPVTHEIPQSTIIKEAPKKVQTAIQINRQFSGLANKHLQKYNLQQDAQTAIEASRHYQQQKNSPIIDLSTRNKFISEDKKLIEKIKVTANCDGAARKAAAILLGFMGGMINCTSKPNIDGFINKRVNKESQLTTRHQQPKRKASKSVVIKD